MQIDDGVGKEGGVEGGLSGEGGEAVVQRVSVCQQVL